MTGLPLAGCDFAFTPESFARAMSSGDGA
jgi:hypothetical protein